MVFKPYAATEYVVLLLALCDKKGVLRVPVFDAVLPGKLTKVCSRAFIGEHLAEVSEELSGRPVTGTSWFLEPNFAPTFTLDEKITELLSLPLGTEVSLYVATWHRKIALDQSCWRTLPEAMRALPSCSHRRYYIQAWQVLMGGLKQDSRVLSYEEGDKVHKSLKNLVKPNKSD